MDGIKAGKIFKSQRELCEKIGIEYKDSTNSRRAQEKEFDRRFKWHKEGRKIIIEEVYAEIKEKIDGRGKSEGSRNNYKGIYAEYIDILLLQYLQKEELKLKDTCKIYTTNNKIAENTGIVNCNYRTAFNNQAKFYNTVKKELDIKTNTYCMRDVFHIIKTKIREIVKASLDRLQRLGKLDYEICYFIYVPYTIRVPSGIELEIIKKSEAETIKEMGVEHKTQIDNSEKLTKEFNAKVLEKVQDEIDYVQSIFKGYSIVLCEDFDIKSDIETIELMTKLNSLVINSLKEKPQKIQEKTIKDEKLELWFGARSPFWAKWVYDRVSKKYIEHCYGFIDILCSLESKNIVDKIKICKDKKINMSLTYEQKEEQKDKIITELMDKMDEDEVEIPY